MPSRRREIPDEEAATLRRLTRRIRAVRDLERERGEVMYRLRQDGYSVGAIAAATEANEEGVRRSIARHEAWLERNGVSAS